MKQEQVWVVNISHQHGNCSFAYRHEQSARDCLARWAREWWHSSDVLGSYADLSDSYLVSVYFDHVEGRESYNLNLVNVED